MTVSMLENIRRIGVFMIAAQTVIHFAAGKQYEKYMKIIAGVIVLLQFLSPFVSSSEEILAKWQGQIGRVMEQTKSSHGNWQGMPYAVESLEKTALRKSEEEIKSKLNDVISDKNVQVTDVSIDLEENAGSNEWDFQCIRVTVQRLEPTKEKIVQEGTRQAIRIDKVTVGGEASLGNMLEEEQERETGFRQGARSQEYRELFAQTMGIAQDRVEVIYLGGG